MNPKTFECLFERTFLTAPGGIGNSIYVDVGFWFLIRVEFYWVVFVSCIPFWGILIPVSGTVQTFMCELLLIKNF